MSSRAILTSKNLYKLQVNLLKANEIKSDNIVPDSPSYLFSAVFENGVFNRTTTGGTLSFSSADVDSIIQFSDRPFRQTGIITFTDFVSLFDVNTSFAEDPPNCVLVHDEEQRTYKITLRSSTVDSVEFNLELLPGESHKLNSVIGNMSFFVDNTITQEFSDGSVTATETISLSSQYD